LLPYFINPGFVVDGKPPVANRKKEEGEFVFVEVRMFALVQIRCDPYHDREERNH
jgi:hypothetical protein